MYVCVHVYTGLDAALAITAANPITIAATTANTMTTKFLATNCSYHGYHLSWLPPFAITMATTMATTIHVHLRRCVSIATTTVSTTATNNARNIVIF